MVGSIDASLVICYAAGTADMLECCLRSIRRHTPPCEVIVATSADACCDAAGLVTESGAKLFRAEASAESPSGVHGRLLDAAMPTAKGRVLVSLDSDCFPVASGWLDRIVSELDDGADLSGVLHPWSPASDSVPRTSMAHRLSRTHCWLNTHVACQAMTRDTFGRLWDEGVRHSKGPDTGLMFPLTVRARGGRCGGLRPTRCPRSDSDGLNPEFNRMFGVVYGDLVYHHGGTSRGLTDNEKSLASHFDWARDRVLDERDASWLLDDRVSHRYRFDREDEVLADKVIRTFGFASHCVENLKDGRVPSQVAGVFGVLLDRE